MNLPLTLCFDPTAHERIASTSRAGWFVVGQSADDWLAELARWEAPLDAATVFVVPTSDREVTPLGLFVVGAGPAHGRPTPLSLPYAVIASRLFLPSDARLDPPISDQELTDLVDEPCLWHPQTGLIRLGKPRRVCDLVGVPRSQDDLWEMAVPGTAVNTKLVSIEPANSLTVAQLLAEAAGDIGSQPLDLDALPPAPNEPTSGAAGEIGRAISRGFASVIHWLAGLAPLTSSVPTWINALDDWAMARLQQIAHASEAARHREIVRLMALLQNDPDEGIRFALPMGGGEHRGLAPPSERLSVRDVNFSIDTLRGGGPADFWNIRPDMQHQLMERYRAIATREIGLGRHRRAAYIYASLLNDFSLAARTLEDGGHYREAAILWKDRLGRTDLAAAAFRKGHCWPEAIELYEKLREHETLGDIYDEMERHDDAVAARRRAVEEFRANGDIASASRVLADKLGRVDESFELLERAWPEAKQAKQCLTAAFSMSRTHGRHDVAMRLVSRVIEKPGDSSDRVWLVEFLAHEARTYPDADVRLRVSDQTRVLVAARLGARPHDDEASKLVTALARLVPEDRLLSRDGHRYLDGTRQRARLLSKVVAPARKSDLPASPRVEVRLPSIHWSAATVAGETIFVAGYRERELVVMRANWSGTALEAPNRKPWTIATNPDRPIALVAHPLSANELFVHAFPSEPLSHPRSFPSNDEFPDGTTAMAHAGFTNETCGAVATDRDTVYVVSIDSESQNRVLTASAYLGRSLRTASLGPLTLPNLPADASGSTLPLPMAVREADLVVGVGCNLCFLKPGSARFEETPDSIERVIAAPPHTRTRLVVAMAKGGFVTWGTSPRAARLPFALEMSGPRVALSRDGTLIAVSEEAVEFYATRNDRLDFQSRWRDFGVKPVAVVASRRANRFAVLVADGRLLIYDVPS